MCALRLPPALWAPPSLPPVFILAFPFPQSSALVLGSHFALTFPGPAFHQLLATLHSHGLWSLSLGFSPSPVVLTHCSGSCFTMLLLHLASAPGGLSEPCPWGVFSGREGCCALSVLPCWVFRGWWGCAVLERGTQQLQASRSCKEQIHVHRTWLWHSPGLLSPAQTEINPFLAGLEAGEAEQRV